MRVPRTWRHAAGCIRPRVALLVCGVASVAACSGEGGPASGALITDSAGVRLVTHRGPAPVLVEIAGDPVLTVADSEADGISLYRVIGAVLTADSGLVVANGGNHEIVGIDPAGAVRWRVGREGDGPGEFRAMTWMQAGDGGTVTVWDGRTRRLATLDIAGTFRWTRGFPEVLDTREMPSDAVYVPSPMVLAAHGLGDFVGYSGSVALPRGSRGPLPLEADFRVYPVDSTRTPVDLGRRTVFSWYEDPGREGMPLANALGAPRMWWGAHSGRLAYTSSEAHEIEVFDRGSLTLIIREDRPRRPFEPDSLPAGYDLAVDSLPAYGDLNVDALHRIWARVGADEEEDPAVWRVWDAEGLWVADVLLPFDARVMDADRDRVVLRRQDELDLERIVVHRMTLPEG